MYGFLSIFQLQSLFVLTQIFSFVSLFSYWLCFFPQSIIIFILPNRRVIHCSSLHNFTMDTTFSEKFYLIFFECVILSQALSYCNYYDSLQLEGSRSLSGTLEYFWSYKISLYKLSDLYFSLKPKFVLQRTLLRGLYESYVLVRASTIEDSKK